MRQVLWKELQLSKLYITFFIFLIPFSYGMNVPITGINIWIMLAFVFLMFYTDSHNGVNRYMASIPIERKHIVLSRYLFLLILSCGFSLYLWLIDHVAHQGLPFLENRSLSGLGILGLFTLICIILSVSLPIFYYFKSFQRAITIFMLLAFFVAFFYGIIVGNPLIHIDETIKKYIDFIYSFQPFLILLTVSAICIFISYKLSTRIFMKKDIL